MKIVGGEMYAYELCRKYHEAVNRKDLVATLNLFVPGATAKAPLSGVVSKRHAQAGEKLSPDSPVFSIVDLKHLTLDAQVPASDIPRVQYLTPTRSSFSITI